MAQYPEVKLSDGHSIPQLGFGVWQIEDGKAPDVVGQAIKAGYRMIDTAESYNNEGGVGEAIRRAEAGRDRLFITSKLRNKAHQRDAALKCFDETMDKLGIEVLDLFLIHWPLPHLDLYVEAWKALIEMQKSGRVRSIGVSNFNEEHLERIIGETGVVPVVNQIELHPRFQQRDKRAYHQAKGIQIECWSPLGQGTMLEDASIGAVARKHGKSAAQVIIRWHLQEGLVAIPKTVTPARIVENFDVFDFSLDAEDMAAINKLDNPKGGRVGADPATARFMS